MKTQKMMMVLGSMLITLALMTAIRAGFDGPQPPQSRIGAAQTAHVPGIVAAVSA